MGRSIGRKISVLLLLCLFIVSLQAHAQSIISLEGQDLSAWDSVWRDWFPDTQLEVFLQSIMDGSMLDSGSMIWESLQTRTVSWARLAFETMVQLLILVMFEMFVSQLLESMPQRKTISSIQWIVLAISILFLAARIMMALKETLQALERLSQFINAAIPILMPLLMTSGWTATSGFLQPATLSLSVWMDQWLRNILSQGLSVLMMIRMADSFHEKRMLKGIINMGKRFIQWFMGLSLTGFVAVVGMQGSVMLNYDSLTLRSARYAVDSTIPGIGGYFADLLDTAVVSAQMIRNSLGVVSLIVVVMLCIEPLILLGLSILTLNLAAALGQVFGTSPLSELYCDLAALMRLVLYGLLTSAFLVMMILSLACMAGAGI